MVMGTWGRGGFSPHGRQREDSNRKGPGQDIAPKDTPPMTYFFQLSSAFHNHLSIAYSNFESKF
jgi:hypothetical protein